jgi:type I restriction enzyme S subunit
MYYRLKDEHFKYHCLNHSKGGANQMSITLDSIKRFEFRLPPLKTQRKIASILSAYDDLIENNLKRIKLLEEQAQQTYEEWFVRFKFPGYESVAFDEESGLPVGWEKLDLNKYITIKHGYAFKGEFFSEEVTNRVLLTPGNFRIGGGIKLNKLKYYDEQIDLQEDYVLQKHDLLITMTDLSKQGDTLGYPLLVPSSYKNTYLHNQRLGKVLPKRKSCFPKYFLRMYFQDFLYRSFVVGSSTGSTVKHTSPKKILFFKPNLPSLDSSLISDFDNLIKPLFETIDNLLLEQDLLKEARDILLPRLMSGMIDVDSLEVYEQLGMVAEECETYKKK